MEIYEIIVNGKAISKNVSPWKKQAFLEKYPDAVLKSAKHEDVKVKSGKGTSPIAGATMGQKTPAPSQQTNQSQNNQQINTESKSEDGSSELRDSKFFKAVKHTMLSSDIGRLLATTLIGGGAIGGAYKRGLEGRFSEESIDNRKKEKESWKNSEATYLADQPIEHILGQETKKDNKILEYKLDSNGKRLYYNPNIRPLFGSYKKTTPGWEEEVDYDYDRSQGVRFKSRSAGKFMDDITYFFGKSLSNIQSGEYTEELWNVVRKGEDYIKTEEDARRLLDIMKKEANKPKSPKVEKWIETFNSEKNWALGFIRATVEDPATAIEIGITSLGGQVSAHKVKEVALLAHGVGASQAAVTYKTKKSRLLATGAYIRGVMSTLGGAVETTSKMGELIREEFDGEWPSERELVALFQDVEKFRKFRNKAILKGLTIAAVDNLGGALVQNSVFKTAKTGKKMLAAIKGGIGESITGAGGEALSQVVIGEEIVGSDVGLEILGQGGQATVDIGTALVPGKYTVNKGRKNEETVSFRKIEEILESATPEEIADMNIEIKNNDALNARVKQQEFKGILLSSIDSRVVDQSAREEIFEKQSELLAKERELKKKQYSAKRVGLDESKVDPALQEEIQNIENDIAQLTESYTALEGTEMVQEAKARSERIADKDFKGNLEFAKKHSALYGLKYKEMTQDEVRKKYGDDAADNSTGFVDPKTDELVINIDVAKEVNDVEVGNHELLHGILRKALKDGEINTTLIQDLKNQIGEQWSAVENRVKDGGYTSEYMAKNPDEWITLTSDAIRAGEITYNESTFQPLIDVITPILRAFGFKKINFKDGKAVFDFLKEYNRSIHKGALSGGIVSETAGKVKTEGDIKTKRVSKSQNPKLDKLGKTDKDGNPFTSKTWKSEGYPRAMKAIVKDEFVRNIIRKKYFVPEQRPEKWIDSVIGSTEFQNMIKRFNTQKKDGKVISRWDADKTPEQLKDQSIKENESLFAYINDQLEWRAGDVYKAFGRGAAPKGTISTDARTTEGAPVVQPSDVDTSFERIDEQDMTLRDKNIQDSKPEVRERRSTFRSEIGIKNIGKGIVFRAVKTALNTAESVTNAKEFIKSYEENLANILYSMMEKKLPDTNSMIKYRMAILESIPLKTLKKWQKELPAKDNDGNDFGNIFVKNHGRKSDQAFLSDFMDGTNFTGKNPRKRKLLPDLRALWKKGAEGLNVADAKKNPEGAEYYRKKAAGITVWERLPVSSTTWKSYVEGNFTGKRQKVKASGTKGNNRIKILKESSKAIGRDATPENLTTEFIQDYISRKKLEGKITVEQVKKEILESIDRPADLKFKRKPKQKADNFNRSANKDINKVVSDSGVTLLEVEKKIQEYTGSKSGEIKSRKIVDFVKSSKLAKGIEKHIGGFLSTHPEYIPFFQDSMTGGYDNGLFGIKDIFYKITGVKDTNRNKVIEVTLDNGKKIQVNLGRFRYSKDGKIQDVSKLSKLKKNKKHLITNKARVDFLEGLIKNLFTYIKKNPDSKPAIVMFFKDGSKHQNHTLRYLAPLVGATIDPRTGKFLEVKITEEHGQPQNEVNTMILDLLLDDNSTINDVNDLMKFIRSSYSQWGLQYIHDNEVTKAGYRDSTPKQFYEEVLERLYEGKLDYLPDGVLLPIFRYLESGVPLNTYYMFEVDQTVTEFFGVDIKNANEVDMGYLFPIQNNLIKDILLGKTDIKTARKKMKNVVGLKHKRTFSQMTADNNILKAFEKQAEIIKKQNKEIQADLEKRGYKFKRKGQTPSEMIKILEKDLEERGYTFISNRGMSTFDFDETLIIDGENFVVATDPKTGETINIKSGEWPTRGPELAAAGYKFNFDDFVNVRGGIDGPLLQKMKNQIKKYGPENVFVLTARPQTADSAIHGWLKSKGVNIPIKNITGLADSRGEVKANWMLEKFAEGYNDMYFVDDALQNVKAVKDVLNQLDVKSKVVQAKLKFKRTASENFNIILEESQGTRREKVISQAEAKKMGKNKGWWRLFVPPSAEDFKGLLYRFLGRGRQGDMHMKYFKIKLLDPFAKGIREWNKYKQNMSEDFKHLQKNMKDVVKKINNKVPGTVLTVDSAIRVYLWNKAGFEIPGITPELQEKLLNYVDNNPDVKAFADALGVISRTKEGYIKPNENWSIQTVASDLNNIVNKVGRKQFLSEFLENSKAIFTPENMNKIEALYGTGFRDALENSLYRMEHGGNRLVSNDRVVNMFYEWINAAIGAIMFINSRSALLQTLSTVNFVNMSDNNIFKAAKAFANQPQYWKDFAMIFNSPQLKQRRKGLQTDVSASELAKTFSEGGVTMLDKVQSIFKYILEKGFTPTQVADSFAIAFGGATFYRNRLNTYLKQGMSEAKAKEQAMLDFQEIAEETQQSSREDLVSQQQAGVLGRYILAFQNVTMQYTRFTKKKLSNLVNRRRIPGYTQMESDMANISGILYYGMVQNVIFGALQSGLMFFLFGWREDDEQEEKKTKRVINGALDSLLRGTGVYGAIVSTIKNTVMRWKEEKKKGWNKDFGNVIVEAVNLSPPIGSKLRKIYSAMKTEDWNPGVSKEIGWRIENPNIVALALTIEGVTGFPIARMINKTNNVEEAVTGNHAMWQRVFMMMGWNRWDVGAKDEELEQAKKDAEAKRKANKKDNKGKSVKIVRCTGITTSGARCKNKGEYGKKKRCYAH